MEYCQSISPAHFVDQNSSFGRGGSIRNLLVYIINTYEFWILEKALKRNVIYAEYEENETIQKVIALFEYVDQFMDDFFHLMETSDKPVVYESKGVQREAFPIKLFSHVITHEYHHKGQILSLSRHLGYIPVDTDIVR